jgi:hypothetical protein
MLVLAQILAGFEDRPRAFSQAVLAFNFNAAMLASLWLVFAPLEITFKDVKATFAKCVAM